MIKTHLNHWISRLPISNKIYLISAPTALVLCFLIVAQMASQIEEIGEAKSTASILEIADLLDHIAHNHAVERGLTAGFLGSKGTQGKEKLERQREKALVARKNFYTFYQGNVYKSLTPKSRLVLDTLKTELDKIPTLHRQVDRLAPEANPFQLYSRINQLSLDIIVYISGYLKKPETVNQLHRLISVLWIKERAGQERGALNGVFAKKSYNERDISKVNFFIEDQATYFRKVEQKSTEAEFETFKALISDKYDTEVKNIRERFFNAAYSGNDVDVEAQYWFEQSTNRIKNIKVFADQTAEETALLRFREVV